MAIWNAAEIRLILWERDGPNCHYCDKPLLHPTDAPKRSPYYPTLDHKTPRSLGGTSHISNLVLACYSCNHRKGELGYEEFLAGERKKPGKRSRSARAERRKRLRNDPEHQRILAEIRLGIRPKSKRRPTREAHLQTPVLQGQHAMILLMQKIPTLFQRNPEDMSLVLDVVNERCAWVLAGYGIATRKWDGTCVLITGDQEMFKRYTLRAKPGDMIVQRMDFIPATDFDPVTGKQEGWVPVSLDDPADWMHREAFERMATEGIDEADVAVGVRNYIDPGTYELIGPKVQGNPEGVDAHMLVRHGIHIVDAPRTYDALKSWLAEQDIEGVVWHHPDGRMAKIKTIDFGIATTDTDRHRLKRGTFRKADVEAQKQAARKAAK